MKNAINKFIVIMLSCFFVISLYSKNIDQNKIPIKFEIIICSYNNERWCIKNLESIVNQTYPYWHATLVIDAATDATYELVHEFIKTHNIENKITVILNEKRQGAIANIYMVAMNCPGEKVIGLVDGDDWLHDEFVLERVAKAYHEADIWLTFGQFEFYPTGQKGWVRPYTKSVIKTNSFRKMHGILPTHFKTFYAWLFHKIKRKDLMHEGEFYPVAGDVAMMLMLIEMAGAHHKCFYKDSEINYVYNIDNPLNDFNTQLQKQLALDQYIRTKKSYKPL